MTLSFYIIVFILGAIMGSFAGVIIERGRGGFERKRWKEILGGRSYCPGCGQTLTWWQLLPLGGWLLQKGKCFRCHKTIPAWYNWMEILMGAVFVVTTWAIIGSDLTGLVTSEGSLWGQLIFWLFVNRALWAIVIADFFWYELNVYLWLLLVVWIVTRGVFGDFLPFQSMAVRGIVWTAIFGLIWLFGRWYVRLRFQTNGEGIGEGDVMMALVIGLLFPFLSLSATEPAQFVWVSCIYLVASSVLGLVFWFGRLLIVRDGDHMLPFLPAMIVAFWLLLGGFEFFNVFSQI